MWTPVFIVNVSAFFIYVFWLFIIKDDSEHVPGRLVSGVRQGDSEWPATSWNKRSGRPKRCQNPALVRNSCWQQSAGHRGTVLLLYSPTFQIQKMETSLFEHMMSHFISHLQATQVLAALACILTTVIYSCVSFNCSMSMTMPVWSSMFVSSFITHKGIVRREFQQWGRT